LISLFPISAADGTYSELNEVNSSDIMANLTSGLPVKYNHVIVKGDLDIDELNLSTIPIKRREELKTLGEMGLSNDVKLITSPITIYNSTIEGFVNFDNAFFSGKIRFIKTDFNKSVNFKGSYFNETADFEDSQFFEDIDLSYSNFAKDARFKRSKFNKLADFRWSILGGTEFKEISFRESQFNGDAYFWGSIFNNTAVFSGSNFEKVAYFREVIFRSNAHFIQSNFNDAYFMNSTFNKAADFKKSQFNGRASFWKSLFNGNASFWSSTFNKSVDFKELNFIGPSNFRGSSFIDSVDFSGSHFLGDASFSESLFNNEAYLMGTTFENDLNLTLAKYKALYIRWSNINSLDYDDSAYLSLIDNFKRLGFFMDANNCYYRYRIDRRQDLPTHYRPIDWILMAFYGYGTKPEYPLAWAVFIIFISGYFFYKTNGIRKSTNPAESRISLGDAFIFSATAFTSGASAIIDSSKDMSPFGASRYVVTLERLLGWIFFALFLTALGKTIIG
jgi:hypothetical protein